MSTSARLQELIEPIVEGLGLSLFDLQYSGGTLSVLIERRADDPARADPAARPGVDIAAITRVSRAVSRALDEADPISSHYSLEVSSPGLERPLRTPAHFVGAQGELVAVKTTTAHDGPRRLKGELVRAPDDDDPSIDLDVDGVIHTVPLTGIERARTVFEWGPEPKPTRPKPTGPDPARGKAKGKGPAPAGSAAADEAPDARPPVSPGPAESRDDRGSPTDPPPPGAEHGGSATPHEPDAKINGDDQKVSAS